MIQKHIFFISSILFTLGIFIQLEFNINFKIILIVLAFLIISLIGAFKKGKKSTNVLLVICTLLICLLGMLRICVFDWQVSKDAYGLIGQEVTCRGIISESPILYPNEGRSVYLLELKEIVNKNNKTECVSGYVRVYDDFYASFYEPGDYVEAVGNIKAFNEFKNPGKSEYKNVNKGRHIIGKMFLKKGTLVIEKTNDYYIERISKKIRDKIETSFSKYLTDKNLPIVISLLFGGNYNNISQEEIQSFSTTGIIHILSVSGSHITLLFGFVYMFGKWLGWKEKITLTISAIVILVYACISGFSPPVIRSSVMGLLAVVAIFIKRDKEALNILGFTVLLMLLWNPYYVNDISFQLSVGASAGILIFYKSISEKLKELIPFTWISEATALSISAQILIVPVILYNFHSFPLYFIFSNIVVTPLLDFVIILGLIAAVSVWILVPLSGGVLYVTDYLLEFSLIINRFIAHLPKARFLIGGMNFFEVVTYYATISFLYLNKKIKKEKLVYNISLIALSLLIVTSIYLRFTKTNEYVIIPNTGKTISVGIISKSGNILYYEDNGDNAGQREFTSVLEYYGIDKVDILILNLEKSKKTLTIPNLPINKILVIGKLKGYLQEQLKEKKYNFEIIKNKEIKNFKGVKININGKDCFIERKTNSIYIVHNNSFDNFKNEKGILFIKCNPKSEKASEIRVKDMQINFSNDMKKYKNNNKEKNTYIEGMIKLNYDGKWNEVD